MDNETQIYFVHIFSKLFDIDYDKWLSLSYRNPKFSLNNTVLVSIHGNRGKAVKARSPRMGILNSPFPPPADILGRIAVFVRDKKTAGVLGIALEDLHRSQRIKRMAFWKWATSTPYGCMNRSFHDAVYIAFSVFGRLHLTCVRFCLKRLTPWLLGLLDMLCSQ